uniref:Uncharacterized protein n=1 Tax=Paramoeba aestuarina TaxID=180227 RepID=A0A7S4UIK2_9EUKA|mmetsp:Transcript_6877/g.10413  ORF Transcript_6877/g.10413 Transcript_6877/m.10413 type:complete len:103 (+) Transcript_6877:78-386(+)
MLRFDIRVRNGTEFLLEKIMACTTTALAQFMATDAELDSILEDIRAVHHREGETAVSLRADLKAIRAENDNDRRFIDDMGRFVNVQKAPNPRWILGKRQEIH